MIIIKSKKRIFDDISYESHNGYYYMYVKDDWRLIANSPKEVENKCSVIEYDDDCYLLTIKPVPFDLQKHDIKGEPMILADDNEWMIPTIADVRYKFTLKKQDGQFIQTMEVCDPLFDLLIDYADKIKKGIEYTDLIELIAKVLERNYYVNKNIILALGLIDTENIEKMIKLIYRHDEMSKLNDAFFRASNDEDATKSVCDGFHDSEDIKNDDDKNKGPDN